MAANSGPNIPVSGLIFSLDSANYRSYPSSGTVWNDLTKRNSVSTLNAGISHSGTIGQGSLFFNNTNGQVNIPQLNGISNALTLSVWVNHTLTNKVQRYITLVSEIAVIRHDGFQSSGQLHFYLTTGGSFKHLRVNSSVVTNTWQHFVGTWDGTNQIVYKNGVQIGSAVPGGTLGSVSGSGNLGSTGEQLNGYLPIAQVYNRALTADEVYQLHHSQKGRFGL